METEEEGARQEALPLPGGTKVIFSLGTSNRRLVEFIAILRVYRIEMAVDVRSFPTSSRFPHFKKESLPQSLAEAGFGYFFLGKELGGYRQGGYEAYTQALEYLAGMEVLERMASRCRSAIFCAERLPWRCHRRFIGRSLRERGWEVIHIIDEKRVLSSCSSHLQAPSCPEE
jgi:uncharacterized protein (DUF488 family)